MTQKKKKSNINLIKEMITKTTESSGRARVIQEKQYQHKQNRKQNKQKKRQNTKGI